MKKNLFLFLLACLLGANVHAQLIINEVLYDPSNIGLQGDANGDGVYSQTQDEFIEFVNIGTSSLNLSGYQIWDDTVVGSMVYVIPNGTVIQPGRALVVFGGSTPVGLFGGATVLADTGVSGLSLANQGEKIAIRDNTGKTILTFDSDALSNNPDESYTRNPDLTGGFVQHTIINTSKFTPGRKVDGSSFVTLLSKQITFKVDLNKYTGSFDSVFVSGNFNQWCNNCNPMLDVNKDGLWEVSVPIFEDTIDYLFRVKSASTAKQEQFTTVSSCTRLSGGSIYRNAIIKTDSILKTACFESCTRCASDLSLKGVTDFITPAKGSSGKSIYLVADSNISNLSIYGLGIANNGGGTNGQEYRFPNISVSKGSQILVARDSAGLAAYMNTCWSNFNVVLLDTNGVINQNGNDAVELFNVGEVTETFGDANQNGTGQPWEYTGSWAFKNNVGTWIYGRINCTDSTTTIFDSDCVFPICSAIKVTSIVVNGEGNVSSITQNGGTLKMLTTVLPANAYNKQVNWSVNDENIAIINNDGVLTGISDGTVIVKATAKDGSGIEGTQSITISGQKTKVSSIEVNSEGNVSVINTKGGTLKMLETVLPVDALNKEVSWSTNDTTIATISSTGILTAVSNGVVIVKATAKDASGVEGTKSITITGQLIKVTSIVVNGQGNVSIITQNAGSLQMLAVVLPNNADTKEVTWSVNDEDIASITAGGLLTALANGTVIVKATAKDTSGVEGTKSITISGQTNGLSNIQKTVIKLYPNPVENTLYIQSDHEVSVYNLYSIYGKLIETGAFQSNQKDFTALEAGVYVLDVKINEQWVRYKIIKK